MKLLLDRGQKAYTFFSIFPLRIGGGNCFTIKGQLELEAHELKLIDKYKLRKAIIADSSFWTDLRRAMPQAFVIAFIAGIWGLIADGFLYVPIYFTTALLIATIIYYREEKERILVSDLIGRWRSFRADTVVDLVHKEAYIEKVCQHLQQLLVTAKHWDDKAIIEIEPLDKDKAKQQVLEDTTYNPLTVEMKMQPNKDRV